MEETRFSFIGCDIKSLLSRECCGCWEDEAEEIQIRRGAPGSLPLSGDVNGGSMVNEDGSQGKEVEEVRKEVGQ